MEIINDVDATKILEKGPDYLRKQIERESETKAGMSAVERLAATKPKYVKSQQVVNSTQEPAISFGSASVSSNGSSHRSSCRSGKLVTERNSPVITSSEQDQDDAVRRSSSKKRPDSLLLYRQKCDLLKGSTHARNRRNLSRRLLLNSVDRKLPLPEATDKECKSEEDNAALTPEEATEECVSKAAAVSSSEQSLTQIAQQNEATEQYHADNADPLTKEAVNVMKKPDHKRVSEVQRRGGGVSRSHSDISSRYSKNFADYDSFFTYCGLDGAVIEAMGKENFSTRSDEMKMVRSVSVSTSDDGFSRNSGDSGEGLQEEELQENIRQETSVIERNARIIKWLYSCKNARETGKKLRDLD